MRENFKKLLKRITGWQEEITLVIDTSTAGSVADAKARAIFFGDWARFYMDEFLEYRMPNGDKLAVEDAVLAFRYAKIAYKLEHERFDYLVDNEQIR
jgi:hypothetical protein